MADGRAFVTEYAGTSDVVQTFAISSAAWDAQVVRRARAPTR
jgi:hypothetical protein